MKVIAVSIVRHTHNYKAMLRFYRDALDMQPVESWDEPDNRGTLFSPGEATGSATIEILELGDEAVTGAVPANVVLSIEVADVDNWHARLQAAGVPIARGLEDAPWGHRSFGVDDPDGFRIWFYEDVGFPA